MQEILLILINFTLPGVLNQGDRVFYYDGNSLGLGGVSIVLENGANPAGAALLDRIFFSCSGFLYSGTEKRGLRVYDSYGNNMGIATIVSNRMSNLRPGPMSIFVPIKNLSLGLKYLRLWDFFYAYHYDYRDDFYQIVKTVEENHQGEIQGFSPLIGLNYRFLNLGIAYEILYGKKFEEKKVIYPLGTDSISKEKTEFDGHRINYGIILKFSPNLSLGYTFTNDYKMRNSDDSLTYPSTHTLGLSLQPPNRVPTKFLAEFSYELWSEPIFIYKFGIEHTIIQRYSLRYGFCLFPDCTVPVIWTTNLTVGFGLKVKDLGFDIGYSYGKRDFANTDFGGLNINEKILFEETTSNILFTINASF